MSKKYGPPVKAAGIKRTRGRVMDTLEIVPSLEGWKYRPKGNDIADANNVFVASIAGELAHGEEKRIGLLIAAAPDMLTVLERIVYNPEARIGGHIRAEAIAAIKKAKGQS
jgi:hypothetical protein